MLHFFFLVLVLLFNALSLPLDIHHRQQVFGALREQEVMKHYEHNKYTQQKSQLNEIGV